MINETDIERIINNSLRGYDNFEKWINSMSDDEYTDRLESDRDNGGFSDAQEEKALNIREPPDDTELRELEQSQEGNVEIRPTTPLPQAPTTRNIIYDNRDRPQEPPSIRKDIVQRVKQSIPKRRQKPTTPTPTQQPIQPQQSRVVVTRRAKVTEAISKGVKRIFKALNRGQKERPI